MLTMYTLPSSTWIDVLIVVVLSSSLQQKAYWNIIDKQLKEVFLLYLKYKWLIHWLKLMFNRYLI